MVYQYFPLRWILHTHFLSFVWGLTSQFILLGLVFIGFPFTQSNCGFPNIITNCPGGESFGGSVFFLFFFRGACFFFASWSVFSDFLLQKALKAMGEVVDTEVDSVGGITKELIVLGMSRPKINVSMIIDFVIVVSLFL